MQTIQDALTAKYDPLTPAIGIRQDSGLNPQQVGERDLESMDKYVQRRINARADRLATVLNTAAAPAYVWPFTPPQLAQGYPDQDEPQRLNTLRLQTEGAAEAVIAGVLGDLFTRAAPRDPKYEGQRDFYLGDPSDRTDTGEVGKLTREARDSVAAAQQPTNDPETGKARLSLVSLRGDPDPARGQYVPRRPTEDGLPFELPRSWFPR